MEGKLNYEYAVQLLPKAFTINDKHTLYKTGKSKLKVMKIKKILLIHFLKVYLLLECKDTFYFFKILQAIYMFLSNITIVIEHDDNFDKSSLKFLASIR